MSFVAFCCDCEGGWMPKAFGWEVLCIVRLLSSLMDTQHLALTYYSANQCFPVTRTNTTGSVGPDGAPSGASATEGLSFSLLPSDTISVLTIFKCLSPVFRSWVPDICSCLSSPFRYTKVISNLTFAKVNHWVFLLNLLFCFLQLRKHHF